MYCVKCGVRLPEGTARCPLCDPPVWDPEGSASAAPTAALPLPQAFSQTMLSLPRTHTRGVRNPFSGFHCSRPMASSGSTAAFTASSFSALAFPSPAPV